MPLHTELPLSQLRVVDLSDRLAGTYCTKLLVDAGADVLKVEEPSGDPMRRQVSFLPGSKAPPGAMFQYLCASKRSVMLDLETPAGMHDLRELLRHADLLVETWRPGEAERRGLSADGLRSLNPSLSMISISAFGRGGPRSEEDLSEFLVHALSGATYSRGRPGREPLRAAGNLAEWTAGALAAAAGLSSVLASRGGGVGAHFDISILEAATLSLVTAPVITESLRGHPYRVNARRAVPGIEQCSDGWVGLFTLTAQQWFDFTVMIEKPELAEDLTLASPTERQNRDAELLPPIVSWMRDHTVEEVLSLAKLLRVPAAPVGNGESIPTFEALAGRGLYVDNPGGFRQPRSMFRFGASSDRPIEAAPGLGEHNGGGWRNDPTPGQMTRSFPERQDPPSTRPLQGIRILDLTAFWSGPFGTGVLAALGAEVIKIESIQHPDPFRFTGFMPSTEPQWFEASPLYNTLNLDKQGLTLNLGSEEGRAILLKLVETADVVVENFTPRVLENFNLGYEQFSAVQPRVILARMPAFGLEGPWRDRPGFAPTMEQITGMAWINGYEDTEPIGPNGYVDPASGAHLALAIVAALISRQATGRGLQVELPTVEVATTITAEQVIEYDLTGQIQGRFGNADPHATPQGVYGCRGGGDENWVAISVQTNAQWETVAGLLDSATTVALPAEKVGDQEGRWAHRQLIDTQMRAWCATRSVEEVLAIMAEAGVPAAPVVPDHEIVLDRQMRARGFWQKLDHPVIGEQWYAGFPFLRRGEPWYHRPAPLLGEDNDRILGDLGFTREQIQGLEQRKVIGRVPLGL